ncbi:MAG TPA: M48 family metallopeptidase [Kiritimatiellia bacterium]|nr:M48 family metallopeptidase [Kiritimatiellia bacterium]
MKPISHSIFYPATRLVLLLIACAALFGSGCATVPETGRRQMILLSKSQEMSLGQSAFQEIKQSGSINNDPEINAMVRQVGERIAAVADLPGAQWEFVVFNNDEPNAFCLPGGKIGVHTGILPITLNEAGLATVIGHEVAHAVARHGAERMSQAIMLQVGAGAVAVATGEEDPAVRALIMAAYGLGTTLGVALPHSRKQELEADHIGLIYMAKAGYDPGEAVHFWQRFADYNRARGGATPWFLRTHPVDRDRIRAIERLLPDAYRYYRPSGR